MRRAAFPAATLLVASLAVGQDASAIIERATGPASRLESDLKVLTDQIGGRVTGSASCARALQWGMDAFRRAGVDSVRLESYPIPAQWEGIGATAKDALKSHSCPSCPSP